MEFDNLIDQDDRKSEDEASPWQKGEEFEAAVELDESLLNFPATGVDSIVTNST
jgi:hypothetical protein